MPNGLLDDRHVVYDLTSVIGVITISQGGTGNQAPFTGIVAPNNRVMVSDVANNKIIASSITTPELDKLSGIAAQPTTINAALQNLQVHAGIAGQAVTTLNKIHLPAPSASDYGKFPAVHSNNVSGSVAAFQYLSGQLVPAAQTSPTTKYLRGDNIWATLPTNTGFEVIHTYANANTQAITLPAGTWFLMVNGQFQAQAASTWWLYIDGVLVSSQPTSIGDPSGTNQVPVFGSKSNVAGNRSVTCNWTAGQDTGYRVIHIVAYKTG